MPTTEWVHDNGERWVIHHAGKGVRVCHTVDGHETRRPRLFPSRDAAAAFVEAQTKELRAMGYRPPSTKALTKVQRAEARVAKILQEARGPAMAALLDFWRHDEHQPVLFEHLFKLDRSLVDVFGLTPTARDALVCTLSDPQEALELAVRTASPRVVHLLRLQMVPPGDAESADLRVLVEGAWDKELPFALPEADLKTQYRALRAGWIEHGTPLPMPEDTLLGLQTRLATLQHALEG